jgi:hypothetical protein
MDWLNEKNLPFEKKRDYYRVLRSNLAGNFTMFNDFFCFVKSGEVQATTTNLPTIGTLDGQSSRPRVIMAAARCIKGSAMFNQQILFPLIKANYPGFSHGDDSKALGDRVTKLIAGFDDPIALSLDGSAFDSTQFLQLKAAVDD